MRKTVLVIITALGLLISGCTAAINERKNIPDPQNGDLLGATTGSIPDNPTDSTQGNSNDSIQDNTAGSLTDGADSSIAVEEGMENKKVECANSYFTDVYSKSTFDGNNKFKEARYIIIQGKDGTKYSAELKYDSQEYTYFFTVKNEKGNTLLSLNTHASYHGDVFKILDLNMDGYADIQFITAEGTMNSVHDFFLWDADAMNFVKAECEDELLFTEIEVQEDYLKLWGRNSASSGIITKYKWEGNKLVKISEEEYGADDEDMNETSNEDSNEKKEWRFTAEDIKIDGKTVLGISYEQLLQTFGDPIETKTYKINPPATEPDYYEYIYVCAYDGFECEFYTGPNEKIPEAGDTVRRFDITSEDEQLDCELFIGIDSYELDMRYGINKIYELNGTESYDLNNIKNVLKSYKPEGLYSEYEKAAIVYHNADSFEDPLAKALVLLFDDNMSDGTDRVGRIVIGYPTAN